MTILERISRMIYSIIISTIIKQILNTLINNQKLINENKRIDKNKKKKILSIYRKIIIKFIVYSILSIGFSIFFCLYLMCFCYVYPNSQYILFKDISISFSIGLIYPFILYLIPTILRKISLKNNSECLFKIGKLFEMIC